jgi:tetratricopeptide (TPR) repeat protein
VGNRKSFPKFAGMKAMSFVIGFLFALVACTEKTQVPEPEVAEPGRSVEGPSPELCAIDSLMWHQPDSALMCLLPYFNDTCCRDVSRNVSENANNDTLEDVARYVSTTTAYNRHYAHLLLAELLYKNDSAQTNRRELLQAVAYFDSLVRQAPPLKGGRGDSPPLKGGARRAGDSKTTSNLAFLDARAHYINGVGYYEQGEMVPACKEYLKTLEVMESHFYENELIGHKAQFMALTYTHLTGLFSDFYLHEQTIYFGKKSLSYYQRFDALSWYKAWILNELGSQYDMLDNMDSATIYYQTAIDILNDTCNTIYRDINTHQTYLSYKTNKQTDYAIIQMHRILSEAENDKEFLSRCLTIGEIYYHEQLFDSAWHYLNKVYQETIDVSCKKQAAEWLLEICKARGRDSEILEYATFLAPFANQEENQSAIKSHLTELFNVFWQREMELQHQAVARRNMKQTMTVVCILLSFILTLLVLHLKRKQSYKAQLETERHSHKMQQAALAGRLRQSNAALKAQSKTASPIVPSSYKQEQNEAESYAEEPVCQQILAVCNDKSNPVKSTIPVSSYAGIALTDAQKAQLKDAAMRHYGPLFEKLKLQYPELKEKDFLYCYLCLLGLDNMQIAVLSQLSYRTIWEREKRLQTLFHADDRIAVVLHEMMIH